MTDRVVSDIWRVLPASRKALCSIIVATGLISGCALDNDGSSSTSSGVSGGDGPVIDLSWRSDPNGVDGYSVYYGSSADAVDNHYADLSVAAGEINPSDPRVQISAYYDLGLRDGEQVCLSIQAFNSYGASDLSNPVCATIN